MHSLIAGYRFVHIRGLWFARPLHREDVGPVVVGGPHEAAFCAAPTRTAAGVSPRIAVPRAA